MQKGEATMAVDILYLKISPFYIMHKQRINKFSEHSYKESVHIVFIL